MHTQCSSAEIGEKRCWPASPFLVIIIILGSVVFSLIECMVPFLFFFNRAAGPPALKAGIGLSHPVCSCRTLFCLCCCCSQLAMGYSLRREEWQKRHRKQKQKALCVSFERSTLYSFVLLLGEAAFLRFEILV